MIAALTIGGSGAVGLLAIRREIVFFVVFAVAVAGAGLVQYYARIDAALWMPAIGALVLFLQHLLDRLAADAPPNLWHPAAGWLAAFFAWLTLTSLANGIGGAQALVAIKSYALVWLIVPVVAQLARDPAWYARFEIALLATLFLQLPFALAQRAASGGHWDAVVGTFGGDPAGGGASGTLMVYCVVGVLLCVSLWERGRVSGWLAGLGIATAFGVVALAEVKAFFVLLPLGLAVQVRRWWRRPVALLLAAAGLLALSVPVLRHYEMRYTPQGGAAAQLTGGLATILDPTAVSLQTGEVSRGAALMLWWTDGGSDAAIRLAGYGAGASRSVSTIAAGALPARLGGVTLNATAAAQLLWDGGLIALILFAAVFVSAMRAALCCSRYARDRRLRARADMLAAICAIGLPLLLYDRALVDGPAVQFLFASVLGLSGALAAEVSADPSNARLGCRMAAHAG